MRVPSIVQHQPKSTTSGILPSGSVLSHCWAGQPSAISGIRWWLRNYPNLESASPTSSNITSLQCFGINCKPEKEDRPPDILNHSLYFRQFKSMVLWSSLRKFHQKTPHNQTIVVLSVERVSQCRVLKVRSGWNISSGDYCCPLWSISSLSFSEANKFWLSDIPKHGCVYCEAWPSNALHLALRPLPSISHVISSSIFLIALSQLLIIHYCSVVIFERVILHQPCWRDVDYLSIQNLACPFISAPPPVSISTPKVVKSQ